MIIFAVQNAIKDPPFTKLDLVSCRNLLIYLESSLHKRVLSMFSYSLRPGGILLLGTSESVSGFDDRFQALDKRWKLFQRLSNTGSQGLPDFFHDRAASFGGEMHAAISGGQRGQGIAQAAERVLLASFAPPSLLVSERGEIIYVQGRIGMFFEPAQGEATQNVFSMARERAARRAASRRTQGRVFDAPRRAFWLTREDERQLHIRDRDCSQTERARAATRQLPHQLRERAQGRSEPEEIEQESAS